jgi:hypothetical protein
MCSREDVIDGYKGHFEVSPVFDWSVQDSNLSVGHLREPQEIRRRLKASSICLYSRLLFEDTQSTTALFCPFST